MCFLSLRQRHHVSISMRNEKRRRTDEDVRHSPLTSLLLEIVLNGRSVIALVQPVRARNNNVNYSAIYENESGTHSTTSDSILPYLSDRSFFALLQYGQ